MSLNKFGRHPFRNPEAPGVSGFLGEVSTVFYSTLFGTTGVGRVSDLICAALARKMAGQGVDELRLRAILLFSFFEAWRAQGVSVTIEAGYDDEKVAVGIGFNFAESAPVHFEGLVDRVGDHEPRDLFEALLSQIHSEADRTYLKVQPKKRRVELVSLLAIPGKVDRAELDAEHDLEVLELSEKSGPAAKSEFIELGDVNYEELLKENGPRARKQAASTGEILAHGYTELTELQDALRAKKAAPAPAPVEEVRIEGVTETIGDDSVMVVEGEETAEADETEIVVPGARGEQVKEFIRRVWPFKKLLGTDAGSDSAEAPAPESTGSSEVTVVREPAAAPEASGAVVVAGAPAADPAAETQVIAGSTDAGGAADSFLIEIKEGSLDYMINKAQKESTEIKKEFQSGKAKRWVDGLMGELVREKARLHEIAQKLNQQIRQKELEFRNRQNTLEEELRRRDDMLRQKNNALNRAKEQLAQAQMTAERLKTVTNDTAADDAQYKAKYQMTQKILSNIKDENAVITKKLEDMKGQLAAASTPARGKDNSGEVAANQKNERLTRQLDEFKRVNQQLLEKLAEAQKKSVAGANVDDLRKRLELASRVSGVHQKEAEQLRLRVEELQREEMRLKAELTRAAIDAKRPKIA